MHWSLSVVVGVVNSDVRDRDLKSAPGMQNSTIYRVRRAAGYMYIYIYIYGCVVISRPIRCHLPQSNCAQLMRRTPELGLGIL